MIIRAGSQAHGIEILHNLGIDACDGSSCTCFTKTAAL
jgi:uncharacterized protein (DUF779 family)